MRITGGQSKGRALAGPKSNSIRPTSDQVKEAIFNIIGHDLKGFLVLDLFSGTGSLGLEALSRGATKTVFVDKAQESVNLIRKNLKRCGFEGLGLILRRDLLKGLSSIPLQHGKAFDLVFLDPPYGKGFLQPMLKQLAEGDLLAPMAHVVAESAKNEALPSSIGRLGMKKSKTYGDTRLTLFINEEEK